MYCISYVIKKGDTLYTLSRQFNVKVEDIIKANPYINVYRLLVDEAICIPVNTQTKNISNYTTYKVGENETLGDVLDGSDFDLGDLLSINDLREIFLQPGSSINVPLSENE